MKDLNPKNISDCISFVLLYMWHVLHTRLHGYITYVVIKINKISMGFFKRHGLTTAVHEVNEWLDVTSCFQSEANFHVPYTVLSVYVLRK